MGVGYEAKVKFGNTEAKVGAAYRANAETSQDAILKICRSADAGGSLGPLTPLPNKSGLGSKHHLDLNRSWAPRKSVPQERG